MQTQFSVDKNGQPIQGSLYDFAKTLTNIEILKRSIANQQARLDELIAELQTVSTLPNISEDVVTAIQVVPEVATLQVQPTPPTGQ